MMKESNEKLKKTRDCGFDNIKDPTLKEQIKKLSKAPEDATNYIFWHSSKVCKHFK